MIKALSAPARHLVATTLLVLAACSVNNGPGDTVKSLWKGIDEGRVADAVKVLSVPPGMDAKAGMALTAMATELKAEGGIASVEIVKEDVNGEVAKVDYKLHLKSPKPNSKHDGVLRHDTLRKTDGQWRLVMI